MTGQSTASASPIARLDSRLRVAVVLLRAAPHAEHALAAAMTLAATAAAWPFTGGLYPFVAIPAMLLLATLIRHHIDGLDVRREALAAAGALRADTAVIQAAGPLAACSAGAFTGTVAALITGDPHAAAHALAPLAAGAVATLVIRRSWLGAPALATATTAALVTSVAIKLTAPVPHGVPMAEARSRVVAVVQSGAVWDTPWLPAIVATVVLVGTQVGITKRAEIKALIRGLIRTISAAVERRLGARSSA